MIIFFGLSVIMELVVMLYILTNGTKTCIKASTSIVTYTLNFVQSSVVTRLQPY